VEVLELEAKLAQKKLEMAKMGKSGNKGSGKGSVSVNQNNNHTNNKFGNKGGKKGEKGTKGGKNNNMDFSRPPVQNIEGRKERKAREADEKEQTYLKLCSEILPIISDIIDHRGGVCALGEVKKDPRILEAIENIPVGFPVKLQKIVEPYSDYVQFLEGGFLATAKGYENGAVAADGVVDTKVAKMNKEPKKNRQDLIIMTKRLSESINGPLSSEADIRTIFDDCMNLRQYVTRAQQQKVCLRESALTQGKGSGVFELIKALVQRFKDLQREGKHVKNNQISLSQLVNCPKIKELAAFTGRKIIKIIEGNPETLTIEKLENGTQMIGLVGQGIVRERDFIADLPEKKKRKPNNNTNIIMEEIPIDKN